MVIPITEILYENHYFNCPNKPKEYLEAHYGYIGENAIFNNEINKYEPNIL